MLQATTRRLPTTGVLYREVRAANFGKSPSRPNAKMIRDAVIMIAIASDVASKMITRSISTLSQLPT